MTIDGIEHSFNVHLPENYDTSTERYDVLFILHGAQSDKDSWIGDDHLAGLPADHPLIPSSGADRPGLNAAVGYISSMAHASPEDRSYFERIERANRSIEEDTTIPGSLADMFDRLELMRRHLGPLAEAGVRADDDGDLSAHLAFLEKIRSARGRGTSGS